MLVFIPAVGERSVILELLGGPDSIMGLAALLWQEFLTTATGRRFRR